MASIHGLLSLMMLVGFCRAKIWNISVPENVQACYDTAKNLDLGQFVGSVFSSNCETRLTGPQFDKPPELTKDEERHYNQLLIKAGLYPTNSTDGNVGHRSKRQASMCRRREYRTLSNTERANFHNAVRRLKESRTFQPNYYDFIAEKHFPARTKAHYGPAFLGWHRCFLNVFEAALKEMDPSVCLPYLDTRLDDGLPDPAKSPLWTSPFLGQGQGQVNTGPFANWIKPGTNQVLRRDGGLQGGELFTPASIDQILSRSSYEEIVTGGAQPWHDVEGTHNAVHVWFGGDMSFLNTASYDPVFYLHHCFIDYIFQVFRDNMASNNRDPQRYPQVPNASPEHSPNAPTGFPGITQADAYRDSMSASYFYEPSPTCSTGCGGSNHLYCDTNINRCVPRVPPPTFALTSDISEPGSAFGNDGNCPKDSLDEYCEPSQNTYCIDQVCDVKNWVMIPVQIINVRPPKFHTYESYPFHDGKIDNTTDIYSPDGYPETKKYITGRRGKPKTYKRCKHGNVGQVYLTSRGINYGGIYKESVIIDNRLAVSSSIGYVAVKKPTKDQITTALIRADDSCGRICRAACRDPVTNEFTACKGAIAVSSEYPLMYGQTYGKIATNVFDYKATNDIPQLRNDSFYLTFYCDYSEQFPYANYAVPLEKYGR